MATDLERRAAAYRERADALDMLDRARTSAATTVALAHSCGGLVAAHLTAGMTLDQAMRAVQAETGLPPETIAHHWRRWCSDRRAEQVAARTRLVMHYAARGWTNAEIAERLGLHPVSVSRIIGRTVGRTRGGRQGPASPSPSPAASEVDANERP